MKSSFRVSALRPEFVEQVRTTRRDSFGNHLEERRDQERHQCRSCLRLTEPGEAYLALSYRPFDRAQPFAECGPIYVHASACPPYAKVATYPAELPREDVVLRSYGPDDEIVDARFVGRRGVERVIRELLRDRRTAYLHARNATFGCFMFRVDRAGEDATS